MGLRVADLIEIELGGDDVIEMDLGGADLRKANFGGANLSGATLSKANLEADPREAFLYRANLRGAFLHGANLHRATLDSASLFEAVLNQANLREASFYEALLFRTELLEADLRGVNLCRTDLRGPNLAAASLTAARIIECNLDDSDITGCRVYGASVWDASLAGVTQRDLIITPEGQPSITVDNLEVAQFVYLLLNNAKIRDVIDTITSKAVLILGRFTPERRRTLDAPRDALRAKNYLPIVFDFEKPAHRDFTETVSTLAHLARFVIADLTDPESISQELTATVPRLLSVPIRPLLLGDQREWGMFGDLAHYPQVIEPLHYTNDAMLMSCLDSDVIGPAELKAQKLAGK
jgi:hypothetical protein